MDHDELGLQSDFIQTNSAAQQQALKLELIKYYRQEIRLGRYHYLLPADIAEKLSISNDRYNQKPPYVFLTANFREGVSLEDFTKSVHKAANKAWITWVMYCFEQRAENSEYHGFHAHMILCRGDKRPFELIREFKSTFRHVLDSDNPGILNIKFIEQKNVIQKVDYIKGIKQTDKMLKAAMDKPWRKSVGLQDLYELGATSLVGTQNKITE